MKGFDYIKKMSVEDSKELRDEFINQNSVDEFLHFLERDFVDMQDFFEESIFLHQSKLGHDVWIDIFSKYFLKL